MYFKILKLKDLLFLFALTTLMAQLANSAPDFTGWNKIKAKELVQSYQGETQRRYKQKIDLYFSNSDILQAIGGWNDKGEIEITLFKKVLQLQPDDFVFILCHELGHILGEVNFTRIAPEKRPPKLHVFNNVEGEADYFAGRCLRKHFGQGHEPVERAKLSVQRTFSLMYGREIDATEKYLPPFSGINEKYPDPECRLTSVFKGIQGQERPHCWYNP